MNTDEPLGIIWGAPAIAKAISRTERATYHMLENGTLPGARKVAGRWCFAPEVFHASLSTKSCGCTFCDIGHTPFEVAAGKLRHYNVKTGKSVACTKREDAPC